MPQSGNVGRIQYTGQAWLGEANLYYYKARNYLPHLGIFAQTDPIGPQEDANIYAYTGNDPVNFSDPSGLEEKPGTKNDDPIEVIGHRGPFLAFGQMRFATRKSFDIIKKQFGQFTGTTEEIVIRGTKRWHDMILNAQRGTAQPYISTKETNILVGKLKIFSTRYGNSKSYDVSLLDPDETWSEIVIIAMKPPYLAPNGTWVVNINDNIVARFYRPSKSGINNVAISITRDGEELKFKWWRP